MTSTLYSNPVSSVSSAPRFGGLTGYKRPNLGNPTRVASNLPAFRGTPFTPGSNKLKAPKIENSKNRGDQGTNVAIPYARVCPIDHQSSLGRIARGDVCFLSRFQVGTSQIGHRSERVVGIDFLNKALGNDDSMKPKRAVINPNWVVGQTVLIGGSKAGVAASASINLFDDVGSIMADNWREASFLQDWVCDGLVMSNDEPYAHTSNGANDVQQFNICVQGPTTCNNGYQDYNGRGVESHPRYDSERGGYGMEGRVALGGGSFYPSYPLQMFDRKIKPLSTLYVGLVATKREMTPEIRAALLENSSVDTLSPNFKKLVGTKATDYESFYTFKFVCFSDRAAMQGSLSKSLRDDWKYAEHPSKKQRPVHQNDVGDGSTAFDPYESVSLTDYRSMVGAWKIGKVMDTAARRKDVFSGGPVDTAEQLTVNVCIEWCDWRMLRRLTTREDIGGYVSGAPMWFGALAIPGVVGAPGVGGVGQDAATGILTTVDADSGRIFNWPSVYTPRGSLDKARDDAAAQSNAPFNNDRNSDTMATNGKKLFPLSNDIVSQHGLYKRSAKAAFQFLGSMRKGIIVSRKDAPKLSVDKIGTLFDSISLGTDTFNWRKFRDWASSLDPNDVVNIEYASALLGTQQTIAKIDGAAARNVFAQIAYFDDDKGQWTFDINRQIFTNFLLASPKTGEQLVAAGALPASIGENAARAVNLLIDYDIEMTSGGMDGVDGINGMASTAPTLQTAGAQERRSAKSGKAKVPKTAATATTATTAAAAATATAPAATATATAAVVLKPTSKPAALSVVSSSAGPASASASASAPAPAPAPSASTASAPAPSGDSNDIYSAIFGASASSTTAEADRSPSSGAARPRVRRTKEAR